MDNGYYNMHLNGHTPDATMTFLRARWKREMKEAVMRHKNWYAEHEQGKTFFLPDTMTAIRYAVSEAVEVQQVMVAQNNPHHPRKQQDWEDRLNEEICDFVGMALTVVLTNDHLVDALQMGDDIMARTEYTAKVSALVADEDKLLEWHDLPVLFSARLLQTESINDLMGLCLFCAVLCHQHGLGIVQAVSMFHSKIDRRVRGEDS